MRLDGLVHAEALLALEREQDAKLTYAFRTLVAEMRHQGLSAAAESALRCFLRRDGSLIPPAPGLETQITDYVEDGYGWDMVWHALGCAVSDEETFRRELVDRR